MFGGSYNRCDCIAIAKLLGTHADELQVQHSQIATGIHEITARQC
jgi:hypothetical protein